MPHSPPRPALANLPAPPPGKTGWPWTEASPRLENESAGLRDLPAVAIVTPSYQQAEFLEEAIRSVLLQGYPKLSYAIMDGGSTDGSLAIIEKYAQWLDAWVSEADGGQAQAIDNGFQRIPGEVLGWLNSDDVFAPGAVWRAVEEFGQHPEAVLVYGNADEISRDGAQLGPATHARQADRQYLIQVANAVPQPSAYFQRRAYEAAGKLDHSLNWALDYDLWIRLADLGPIVYIPEILSQMRIYPQAKTSGGAPAMFDEFRVVGERYGGFGLLNQMVGWLVPALLPKALTALNEGDFVHGHAWLTSVIANEPGWRSESRLGELLAGAAWRRINEAGESSQAAVLWAGLVCRGLPATFIHPKRVERQVLGLLYEALAFCSFRHGQVGEGLRNVARAIAQDHRRAANRGLWSIAVRSLIRLPV
jgi:hypothetical protein